MQKNLLGWTPGYYEQPIIVCNISELKVKHLMVLRSLTKRTHTPHDAYKYLTEGSECVGIWVKTAGALRFYAQRLLVIFIL